MKVTLCLTHRCNLACSYCYAPEKPDGMTLKTAEKALALALSQVEKDEEIQIHFQGGEPLLCFPLIQDIVGLTHHLKASRFAFQLTTNGTLLSQEMLDFFAEEDIALRISFDGPARIHNRNRFYPSGIGSYALVLANLRRAISQVNVTVDSVFGPETLSALPETLEALENEGVNNICFHLNYIGNWPIEAEHWFEPVYRQIANRYIKAYREGRELEINLIDHKITLMLKGGYPCGDPCMKAWAVAPDGKIYPCDQLIERGTALCLGNVWTGMKVEPHVLRLHQIGCANERCGTCSLNHYCKNQIPCANYLMMGDVEVMSPIFCASEKAAIHAAQHVFSTLFQENNQTFINHLAHHLEFETDNLDELKSEECMV